MNRAEFIRQLHEARVEAYARALADTGPVATSEAQRLKWSEWYASDAEKRVAEYERAGVFGEVAERVA